MRKFVIDFTGGPLNDPQLDLKSVYAATAISGGGAKVTGTSVDRVPETGVMRLAIDAEIEGKDPVELRAHLIGYGRKLTETWLYQWHSA